MKSVRRLLAAAILVAGSSIALLATASDASAGVQQCTSTREYAILAPSNFDGPYGSWAGLVGAWNRAYMASATMTGGNHITSEAWLIDTHTSVTTWVETGLWSGYNPWLSPPINAYVYFGAYNTSANIYQQPTNIIETPNDTTNDTYGLELVGGTTWSYITDGVTWYTPSLGFSAADLPNMGAECNVLAQAHTFFMSSDLITSAGVRGTWPFYAAFFSPNPPVVFNGVPGQGTWSWNTK